MGNIFENVLLLALGVVVGVLLYPVVVALVGWLVGKFLP